MARRKRASMREGPLADLFRSTVDPDDPPEAPPRGERPAEDETGVMREQPARPAERRVRAAGAEPSPRRRRSTKPSRARARVRAPRTAERGGARLPRRASRPAAKERLSRIFADDVLDVEGPAYGRDEPSYSGDFRDATPHAPVIRVVGVGGAGVNAINRMVEAGIPGVEFMAVNTDLQSLQQSNADVTVHLGSGMQRGLGAGSNPELGYRAAFEEQDKIKRLLKGSDMVFVTCGAGGGTGTGAAPVIARLARDVGALTVGIVTKPFRFEGTRRADQAEEGVEALGAEVDTLIVVPNERLLTVLAKTTTMVEAFQVADDVLRQGVQGISELITLPGMINLDFADVRTTMRDAGQALLGIGMGAGDNRAVRAAESAVSSPLLETSVDGARSILLSITGGPDLTLLEVSEAAKIVQEAAHPDANIIFGANVDETIDDEVWITVIATRFDGPGRRADLPGLGERRGIESDSSSGRRAPAAEHAAAKPRRRATSTSTCPSTFPAASSLRPRLRMSSRGVVAAGHPVTAEAGARVLREGGNAVDAAVAAVMTSFVTESPLTGLGAGGYMLVHTGGRDDGARLLRRRARGGRARARAPSWSRSRSTSRPSRRRCSTSAPPRAASRGRRPGSSRRWSVRLRAAGRARGPGGDPGARGRRRQPRAGLLPRDPGADPDPLRGGAGDLRARRQAAREGDLFRFPELGDALERLGAEGSEPFYRGQLARLISDWVLERGGTLGAADLAAYEPIAREPVSARFRGREVLTNPPPSSGGS